MRDLHALPTDAGGQRTARILTLRKTGGPLRTTEQLVIGIFYDIVIEYRRIIIYGIEMVYMWY